MKKLKLSLSETRELKERGSVLIKRDGYTFMVFLQDLGLISISAELVMPTDYIILSEEPLDINYDFSLE